MIDGKVALVCGAADRIGRAIALDLAANGARVLVNDTGESAVAGRGHSSMAHDVVAQIQAAGGEAAANVDSVSTAQSARAVVAHAMERFGRVDIVVTNASDQLNAVSHDMSDIDFNAVLQRHLFGSYYLSRAAAVCFIDQQAGAYVHMISTAGLIGCHGQAAYASATLAIAGLSRNISFDLKSYGVRSNCVAPSAFDPLSERLLGASSEAMGLPPEQLAPLVTFLASDAAAGVTGQIMGVRGNELYLYNQPRPVRTMERAGGWTPQSVADELLPAWASSFTPPDGPSEVFAWTPV